MTDHDHEWVTVYVAGDLRSLRSDILAWEWSHEAENHPGPWRACPACARVEPLPTEDPSDD